jgi:hypothetical protein
MTLALVSWLACTVLGLILIDLDVGPRLVSLTMGHGVTLTDAMAAALLLAGWLAPVVTARRRPLTNRIPMPGRLLSTVASLASGASLVTAALLMPDFAGRKFVVAGFVLLVECAAAATVLAQPRNGAKRRRPTRAHSHPPADVRTTGD